MNKKAKFTELYDNEDKPIYEGDTVKVKDSIMKEFETHIVVLRNGAYYAGIFNLGSTWIEMFKVEV